MVVVSIKENIGQLCLPDVFRRGENCAYNINRHKPYFGISFCFSNLIYDIIGGRFEIGGVNYARVIGSFLRDFRR